MTASDRVPEDSGAWTLTIRGMLVPERTRLTLYLICLAISFCLYLLVHGRGQGLLFWLLAAVAAGGAGYGMMRDVARQGRLLQAAVILAAGVALAIPLGAGLVKQGALAAAMASSTVWPQMLVLLFASRVLAELAELRFAAAWRNPFRVRQALPVQSAAAALALGAFFTLLFYQVVWHLAGRDGPAPNIVVAALLGDTAIHHAIVLLFFVIVAFVIDAGQLHVRDRVALGALRAAASARGSVGPSELRSLVATELSALAHMRAIRLIEDALDPALADRRAPSSSSLALAGFHQASRRFVKGLVPLLPLLGFLGTVIGLSIALAELPHGLGEGRRGVFDIGGSLAGLAIKFETTLLGLLAGMIASFAISVLEKAEAELAAECSLLVEAAQVAGRADAG
jgi:biopolymer transport protein ExbB/TolQ